MFDFNGFSKRFIIDIVSNNKDPSTLFSTTKFSPPKLYLCSQYLSSISEVYHDYDKDVLNNFVEIFKRLKLTHKRRDRNSILYTITILAIYKLERHYHADVIHSRPKLNVKNLVDVIIQCSQSGDYSDILTMLKECISLNFQTFIDISSALYDRTKVDVIRHATIQNFLFRVYKERLLQLLPSNSPIHKKCTRKSVILNCIYLSSTYHLTKKEAPPLPTIESDEDCCICMDSMKKKVVTVLECEHLLHQKCFDRWNKENKTCPLCRSDSVIVSISLCK